MFDNKYERKFFYLSIFDYLLIEKRNSHTNKQIVNEMEKFFFVLIKLNMTLCITSTICFIKPYGKLV